MNDSELELINKCHETAESLNRRLADLAKKREAQRLKERDAVLVRVNRNTWVMPSRGKVTPDYAKEWAARYANAKNAETSRKNGEIRIGSKAEKY